jgi:hypothetical protein
MVLLAANLCLATALAFYLIVTRHGVEDGK